MKQLIAKIQALARKPFARGASWLLLARLTRIVVQAIYFVLIARSLGVDQYGAYAGVAALVSILTPFASWGTGNILVKHVARDRSVFSTYWGNVVVVTAVSGAMLVAAALVIGYLVLPDTVSPWLILLVAIADLLFVRLLDNAAKAFTSVEQFTKTAQIDILISSRNLIAAIALWGLFQNPTAVDWGLLYLISSVLGGISAYSMVNTQLGPPKPSLATIKPELVEGFHFSVGHSAQTIYNDIDKTMLASMASLEATGVYAAAYRIIAVALVPLSVILSTSYPKFFRHGATGISGTLQFAKKILPLTVLYGVVGTVGLIVIAPVVPLILGDEYISAVEAIRWLAPLLILKAISYIGADTLTGAGFQGIRSSLQVGVAGFNAIANLWVIPLYTWRGAAWSSLVSDALLALVVWYLVFHYLRQQRISSSKP